MSDEAELVNRLWGGTVRDYAFNLEEHSFTMRVEIPHKGAASEFYVARMEGVVSFHLETDIRMVGRSYLTEPWNYVELTTIAASVESSTSPVLWHITLEYWQTTCRIVCCEFQVAASAGGD